MRTLAFDGRTGASGDMLLAALLDAGADRGVLDPVEAALPVEYRVRAVDEHGIAATAVTVHHDDADAENRDAHEHDHEHGHAEGAGPTRTLPDVRDVVRDLELPRGPESTALGVFERLAEAEAAVHGSDVETAAFHEVGADDAIADVVGTALLVHDLDPDRVVTTPVAAGGGEVDTAHGTVPVPTPAVLELAAAADWDLRGGPVDRELLTPTGAAILAHLADGVEAVPGFRVAATGTGAGGYDLGDRPNVIRAILGDGGGLDAEAISVLETNLDDASPEVLGGLHDTLADAGALDVAVLPATMKKARPGHLVTVVTRPADAERVARRLAEETGTLGVREVPSTHRWVAARDVTSVTVTVDGEPHDVAVKVGRDPDGDVFDVSAEFDDAAAVTARTGVPIRDVMRRAEAEARDRLD